MKNLNYLLTTVLFLLIYTSCSKDQDIIPNLKKPLLEITFEKNNDGFIINGNKPLNDIKKVTNHCGRLFRGKTAEFTKWKGYDFEGNKSNFIGYDMGSCKGASNGIAKKTFTIETNIPKLKSTLSFKYYRPGDFTGWKNNKYNFNVLILKKGTGDKFFENPEELAKLALIKFEPKINKAGWATFSQDLSIDLPSAEYDLFVYIANGSAAIDDIKLIKK